MDRSAYKRLGQALPHIPVMDIGFTSSSKSFSVQKIDWLVYYLCDNVIGN